MLQLVRNYCSAFAAALRPRQKPRGRLGDARFTSFMAQNNRPRNTDLHDAVLRGRKLMKNVLRLSLIGGAAWIVLESAKALSVF